MRSPYTPCSIYLRGTINLKFGSYIHYTETCCSSGSQINPSKPTWTSKQAPPEKCSLHPYFQVPSCASYRYQ